MIEDKIWIKGSGEMLIELSAYKTFQSILDEVFNKDAIMECAYSCINRLIYGVNEEEVDENNNQHIKDNRFISFVKNPNSIDIRFINRRGNGVSFEFSIIRKYSDDISIVQQTTVEPLSIVSIVELSKCNNETTILQNIDAYYLALTNHNNVTMLLACFGLEHYSDLFKALNE